VKTNFGGTERMSAELFKEVSKIQKNGKILQARSTSAAAAKVTFHT